MKSGEGNHASDSPNSQPIFSHTQSFFLSFFLSFSLSLSLSLRAYVCVFLSLPMLAMVEQSFWMLDCFLCVLVVSPFISLFHPLPSIPPPPCSIPSPSPIPSNHFPPLRCLASLPFNVCHLYHFPCPSFPPLGTSTLFLPSTPPFFLGGGVPCPSPGGGEGKRGSEGETFPVFLPGNMVDTFNQNLIFWGGGNGLEFSSGIWKVVFAEKA